MLFINIPQFLKMYKGRRGKEKEGGEFKGCQVSTD
jgi:hypothetical protein